MNSVGSHLGRGSSNLANIPAGGLGGTGAVGVNGAANQKITPEEQVIMIEANRLKAVQDGNPVAKLLPITPLTSQTLGEDGGNSGGGNANGQ